MPAITQTALAANGVSTLVETTLNGTDTFSYSQGTNQVLLLRNPTAGAIIPKLVGDAASAAYPVPRAATISLVAGFTIPSIAAGSARRIRLDSVGAYLEGNCSITTGTGLVASLYQED
jgi:hypothetical protein